MLRNLFSCSSVFIGVFGSMLLITSISLGQGMGGTGMMNSTGTMPTMSTMDGGMGTMPGMDAMPGMGTMPGMGMMGGSGNGLSVLLSQAREEGAMEIDETLFTYNRHEGSITSICLTADDNWILSASTDKTAQIWHPIYKQDENGEFRISSDAQVFRSFSDVHKQGLTSAIFSMDNEYVFTSSYDRSVRLWKINNSENVKAFTGSKDRVWKIACDPSGEYIAAACNDGTVTIWNIKTIEKVLTLQGHEGPVFDLSFSPDGTTLATASADKTIRLWNLGTGREVGKIDGHLDKVYSVRFSADGNYLLSASRDKTARIWNPRGGDELCRFVGHTGAVHQAIFGGNYVCTASDDGTVRVWMPEMSRGGKNNNRNMNAMPGMDTTTMGGGDMLMGAYPLMPGGGMSSKNSTKPQREPGKAKGIELLRFRGDRNDHLFAVAMSSDQYYVLGGGSNGKIYIWEIPGAENQMNMNQYNKLWYRIWYHVSGRR